MPFQSVKPRLKITAAEREELGNLVRSRTAAKQRVERAKILLHYADGESVSAIAQKVRTNRPRVHRCIDKALEVGVLAALSDLPGRGKKAEITPEAKTWLLSLACQKPSELGYSQEL